MSRAACDAAPSAAASAPLAGRLLLLGTGTVGSAFVERWRRLQGIGLALPRFHALANSRAVAACGGDPAEALRAANGASGGSIPCGIGSLRAGDIVVDATASDAIASLHAHWLAGGVHVVTANKLGTGAELLRAQAIARARLSGGARYGDAATVGAGLPVLRSLRGLRAGGDRVHAIAGVLSGSLAWLFDHCEGGRPFSGCIRQARDAGYTEPDPREDLSGEDVRRKLLILARAAGLALEAHEVAVESLLTPALAAAAPRDVDAMLPGLDAALAARHAEARRAGAKLRFIARLRCGDEGRVYASVGLEALATGDPLAAGAGTDNRVAIWSDRYHEQPLVVQGPGAGAEVTAAALLDDVLRISQPWGGS